jgi:hypothetical protein
MAKDANEEIGNAFAKKACALMKEFTQRLERMQGTAVQLLDMYHGTGMPAISPEYTRQRIQLIAQDFNNSMHAYNVLIRQSSQWVQHGKSSEPSLQLELEIRLADFERMLSSMQQFFAMTNIS